MGPLPRLYLITNRHQVDGGDLLTALEAAMVAGVRLVQLREKDLTARDLLALGRRVKALTDRYGAKLLINGRADVALALGAGVHLPSVDPPMAAVRAMLGADALIGVSCHSDAEVAAAGRGGASFATFGPVYDTPSKRGMGDPVGVSALARVVAVSPIPLFALGGVTPARAGALRATGCHGFAAISALIGGPNPGARCGAMVTACQPAFGTGSGPA